MKKRLMPLALGVGWAGKHRELPNNYLVKISKKNSEKIVNPDF